MTTRLSPRTTLAGCCFPQHTSLKVSERRATTIRHALTMRAGLEWNEDLPSTDTKNDEIAMDASPIPWAR